MANIVYRKGTTPSNNTVNSFKGSPLTNDEMDGNFYGLNEELATKAPINNAAFTGTTNIPNAIITGGTINGVTIGNVTPSPGTFTSVTTTGNVTVGNASDDILIVQAGTQTSPAIVKNNDLNTGIWFPADDIIAISAGGSERIRATSSLVTVTGNQTITGVLAVNDGDITTTATGTATLFNANATTLNIGGAATSLTIGATTGTATIRNASVVLQGDLAVNGATSADVTTTTTTATLFNATATTLSIGGAATTLNVGNASAAQTINLGNASTGASTYNVGTGATASTFTKTVNLGTGGAAGSTTNVNIGSSVAGTTTINSGTVVGASTTQNLWNTVATTINFGGAATTLEIGASTGTTNINNNLDVDGTLTIDGSDLIVSAATFNLANTNATTLNFAGAATTLNIGNATAATATIRPGTVLGANTTQNLWNTIATTVNFAGAGTAITIGATTGTTTIRNANVVLEGDLAVNGATSADITTTTTAATVFNANATTLSIGGAATTLNLGNSAAAQTISIGNASTGTSTYNIGSGATASTFTKTVNLGTGGVSGSTTNVNIGSGVSGSTTNVNVGSSNGTTTVNGALVVNNSTTLNGTVSSNNTITGTRFISNIATGTSPLQVTSTTLVSNLNADRVDGFDFSTVNTSGTPEVDQTGGVAYAVSASSVSFVPPGPSGRILQSNGIGAAPSWITPNNISAGSSAEAANISGGTNGQILYQGAPSVTNKLPIGAANTVLTSSGTIPQWSTSLTLAGTMSHAGLVPTSGTNIDQIYEVTDNLTVTTAWVNTSINATDLPTGSYMVQLVTGTEIYTGVMSWYNANISSSVVDEIVLHKASAGSETSALFLRVERTDNDSSPDMTLQISSSVSRVSASYTFKFRRMI